MTSLEDMHAKPPNMDLEMEQSSPKLQSLHRLTLHCQSGVVLYLVQLEGPYGVELTTTWKLGLGLLALVGKAGTYDGGQNETNPVPREL